MPDEGEREAVSASSCPGSSQKDGKVSAKEEILTGGPGKPGGPGSPWRKENKTLVLNLSLLTFSSNGVPSCTQTSPRAHPKIYLSHPPELML